MTFRYDDRVKVLTTSPGTGAIPAAAAAAAGAFIQLSAIASIANGDIIPYSMDDGASLFEDGYGTWNSTTGLARTTVTRNSAGNTSNLNFNTGVVTVRCSAIKASLPLYDNTGKLTLGGALAITGALTGVTTIVTSGAVTVGADLSIVGTTFFPTAGGITANYSGGTLNLGGFGFATNYGANNITTNWPGFAINNTSDERLKNPLGDKLDYWAAALEVPDIISDFEVFLDESKTGEGHAGFGTLSAQKFAALFGGLGVLAPDKPLTAEELKLPEAKRRRVRIYWGASSEPIGWLALKVGGMGARRIEALTQEVEDLRKEMAELRALLTAKG